MKTMKIFAAVLGLFLMVNVNVALAQETEKKDSIYGLRVPPIKVQEIDTPFGIRYDYFMDLSFYSTYNKDEVTGMRIVFYENPPEDDWDENSDSYLETVSYEYNNGIFRGNGDISFENIDENIYKININDFGFTHLMLGRKTESFRFQLYLIGKNSDSLLKSSADWQSNVLTFFFDPLNVTPITTFLKNISKAENYTYKYFLLSGIEIKEKPIGVPFIQVCYEEGEPIGVEKYLGY